MLKTWQYFSLTMPLTWLDFQKKTFLFVRVGHLKKILVGQGFRGGSDEKMRRMWLGLEIFVVGLPSLVQLYSYVASVKLVIVSVKITYNIDYFRMKCLV